MRSKSPARSQLRRVDLGDPSEANGAGSDEVQQIQTEYVADFVKFTTEQMHSSVKIGRPVRKWLAFEIPVEAPNGFSGIDGTLSKIKERYPMSKFSIDRNGYQGTFSLPYTSTYGPRNWRMFVLKLALLIIWCLFAYIVFV